MVDHIKRDSQISAYADDHQLCYSHGDPDQSADVINPDGEKTACWYRQNLSKYHAMATSKVYHDLHIEINSLELIQRKNLFCQKWKSITNCVSVSIFEQHVRKQV